MGLPRLVNTVLDGTDIRRLAEFYRELLGLTYRPGDEPPTDGDERPEWLVLCTGEGERLLAFQRVDELPRTTWPSVEVPMQLHLCFIVDDADDLDAQCDRARDLGAELLLYRTDDPEEILYVLADPAGHPFCLYSHPRAAMTGG
ncbi:VOC family protein [Kineococcus gynurae]|uniref:VOC family protein n=1 Tax=Kineococcus gynurae TaxID=452979 RepID=A0ABV5LRH7_9ACTN